MYVLRMKYVLKHSWYLCKEYAKYFPSFIPARGLNDKSASICKIHRNIYARQYPTVVVLPDGSSINIRYHEPRMIIKLPLDVSTLSEEDRRIRLEKRKPKKKVKIEEDIDDDFDATKYINLFKK